METIYNWLHAMFAQAPEALLVAVAIVVPIVFLLTVFLTVFAGLTLVERKSLGRFQNRYGPNRVGRWGILQPMADGLKLLTKEDIVPRNADQLVHFLAPVLVVVPALLLYAVLPLAPGLVAVDLNIGILFAFAISTASVLALFMAGWASRNKFSLLGAMRAVAQVISYEVPMVLSAVAVVMAAGSLSTVVIVEKQGGGFLNIQHWYIWKPWGFVGCGLFMLGVLAETGRTPFDLPEGESEIVAGYHTEYSGFKFALFQMGEYLTMLAMGGLTVTMFLGGYQGPGTGPGLFGRLISFVWFFAKLGLIAASIIWIRGTWPRLRVDQLMAFAWKVLLPMAVVNIVAVAIWYYLGGGFRGWVTTAVILLVFYLFLTRLSVTSKTEKREYRYVS